MNIPVKGPVQAAIIAGDSANPPSERASRRARLIAETREFWQPRAGRKLHDEDARQIAENAVGFFDLLHQWDAEEKAAASKADKG